MLRLLADVNTYRVKNIRFETNSVYKSIHNFSLVCNNESKKIDCLPFHKFGMGIAAALTFDDTFCVLHNDSTE